MSSTPLTGTDIKNTYGDVLQFGVAGAGAPASTPIPVADGFGNQTPLLLSQSKMAVSDDSNNGPVAQQGGTLIVVNQTPVPSTIASQEAIEGVQAGKYAQQTPSIQQLIADTGYVCGRAVIIQGSGLLSCTSVTFGGVRAPWVCVNSDSIIRCKVPPASSAGAVNVVVTCAANPGQTAPSVTITNGFTYSKYTNGGSQTKFYQAANPGFVSTDTGSIANLIDENEEGLIFFACGLGPFLVVGAVAEVYIFYPGGTAFVVIANQNTFQFDDNRFHGIRGLCNGGDGAIWCIDHHSSLSQFMPIDPAFTSSSISVNQFTVTRYTMNQMGDASSNLGNANSPMVGPDGWLYILSAVNVNGTPYGAILKVNPFNPLQQDLRSFPLYSTMVPAACGVDGTLYVIVTLVSDGSTAIVQMDTNFNVLQTVNIPFVTAMGAASSQVSSLILGGDLNFYLAVQNFASPYYNYVIQISGSNLATQSHLLVPTTAQGGILILGEFGADGNIWGVLQNGYSYLGAASTDSEVVQISPTSFTILNTYTLTGSVGGSPTTHPGCAGNVIPSNLTGKMYVTVQQDEEASPDVQGYVVEIG